MDAALICCADGCVNERVLDDLPYCRPHVEALMSAAMMVKIAVKECTIDGCTHPPRSTYSPYCHKHDGRIRRHGNALRAPMADVLYHSHGYRMILAPGHPMARGQRAYEHRKVFYDANPQGPGSCHWCGLPLDWKTVEVDHINAVRDDNRLDNLVAACGNCNRDRAKPKYVRAHKARAKKFMINGKWWSIDEAAKALGINRTSITARLKAGWPPERALTEPRGQYGPSSSLAEPPK